MHPANRNSQAWGGGGAGESGVASQEVIPVWGLRGLVMTWHGIGLGGCLPDSPSTADVIVKSNCGDVNCEQELGILGTGAEVIPCLGWLVV